MVQNTITLRYRPIETLATQLRNRSEPSVGCTGCRLTFGFARINLRVNGRIWFGELSDFKRRRVDFIDATKAPLSEPVGKSTLGSILNVLGLPVDDINITTGEEGSPIHRLAL